MVLNAMMANKTFGRMKKEVIHMQAPSYSNKNVLR
jgi:hypothetical protein